VTQALELEQQGILSSDIHGIQFPGRDEPAIADLPVWPDGKKCVLPGADGGPCGYIQRTRYGIQKHCRGAHGWVNRRARGRNDGTVTAGGEGEAWIDGIHCQRLAHTGILQRLYEVAPPACTDERGGTQGGQRGPADQVLSQFKALAEAIKDSDRKAAAEIGEQSRVSANMWVRRTGWSRHLRGFDREWLASMTAQPRDRGKGEDKNYEDDEEQNKGREVERATSEEALSRVLLAVERVIWRAQRVSRVDVVGSAAINYISRREAGGDSNEKPFHAEQKGQTMERYTESWKSVVAYIWRTAHLSPAD
ncbi:hypothetical protein QBC38DRAFT_330062, partial [Podospora fimiseda]